MDPNYEKAVLDQLILKETEGLQTVVVVTRETPGPLTEEYMNKFIDAFRRLTHYKPDIRYGFHTSRIL